MRDIKSALITGPTGAIGTALCRLLAEKNIKVYAVVRPDSQRIIHLQELDGVEVVECDASEISKLPDAIPPVDSFFHFAWAKTVGLGRNDMSTQIKNVQYTLDAVQVAAMLNSSVFIGSGSQAEYGRVKDSLTPDTPCFPENGYGMAKLCAGQMSRVECEKLSIDHIWPRFLSVYGPYDGEDALITVLIKKLLCGQSLSLTAGEQLWDYLFADDAAEALYKMAMYGKAGKIYTVGSGTSRLLRNYLEILRDEIDPSIPLGFGEIAYGDKQVMHLEADISLLEKDTGFKVKTDFEAGIRKTIKHMRKQMNR